MLNFKRVQALIQKYSEQIIEDDPCLLYIYVELYGPKILRRVDYEKNGAVIFDIDAVFEKDNLVVKTTPKVLYESLEFDGFSDLVVPRLPELKTLEEWLSEPAPRFKTHLTKHFKDPESEYCYAEDK